MLGKVLGFGGRIGRLRFLGLLIILGCVAGGAIMAMAFASFGTPAGRAAMTAGTVPPGVMAGGLFVVTPIWLWFFLALHAKRVRDIGWNPLYVVSAWVMFNVVDTLMGAASAGSGGSMVGSIVNLTFFGVLLFWPGRGGDVADWTPPSFGRTAPAMAPPPPPAAPVAPAATLSAPSGFGRRVVRP